jgi:hypothetical protein
LRAISLTTAPGAEAGIFDGVSNNNPQEIVLLANPQGFMACMGSTSPARTNASQTCRTTG